MSTFARRRLVQVRRQYNRNQKRRTESEVRISTQKAAEGGTLRNIYFGSAHTGTHGRNYTTFGG